MAITGAEEGWDKAGAFETLRQFARRLSESVDRCELCKAALRREHGHLLEMPGRTLRCACDACSFLFLGRTDARFKAVPRHVRLLKGFQMTDAEWDSLLIPINLAYFVQNGADTHVSVMYPSPAGATESLLPLDTWSSVVEANTILNGLQPDVEALLVNRVGHARQDPPVEYYIAPIDECYHLVGLIRAYWHGLSGGEEVWREIGSFFTGLRSKAEVVTGEAHA